MGWNLPPGVTDRMIEEAAGAFDEPKTDEGPDELDLCYQENQRLRDAVAFLRGALQTTAGNIRSLGPAGALDAVPMPYREWLLLVETALAHANEASHA